MARMDECKNRFDLSKCDEWIIKTFEVHREIIMPWNKDMTDHECPCDYPGKADEICNKCKYFDK